MSNQDVGVNRGAVLLKELKDLVDSFPEHHRKEVIRIFRTVFSGLNSAQKVSDGGERGSEQQRVAKTAP